MDGYIFFEIAAYTLKYIHKLTWWMDEVLNFCVLIICNYVHNTNITNKKNWCAFYFPFPPLSCVFITTHFVCKNAKYERIWKFTSLYTMHTWRYICIKEYLSVVDSHRNLIKILMDWISPISFRLIEVNIENKCYCFASKIIHIILSEFIGLEN